MNRGIVMEMKAKTLIVMTPEGKFDEISRSGRDCQLGEEIVYAPAPAPVMTRRQMGWASGVAAAVVFGVVVFTGMQGAFASPEVVAYVSMDINPSVEFGIDAKEKVRELRGLNADGQSLIRDLEFKGKPLTEMTEQILQRADDAVLVNKPEAEIVIASTKVKADAKLDDAKLAEAVEQQVNEHVQKEFPQKQEQFVVTAFSAPKEAREMALENGVSPGKMAIYLKAKENGQDVAIDDFKTKSIQDIAKEYGGVGSFIGSAQLDKEELKQLVKEEKDGTLEKINQEKKSKKDDPKKATSTPVTKPSTSPTPKPTPKPTLKPTVKPTNGAQSPGKASPSPSSKNNDNKNDDKNGNGNKNGNSNGNSNGNGNGNGNGNKSDDDKNNDNKSNDDNKNNDNKGGNDRKSAEATPEPTDGRSSGSRDESPTPKNTPKDSKGNEKKSDESGKDDNGNGNSNGNGNGNGNSNSNSNGNGNGNGNGNKR